MVSLDIAYLHSTRYPSVRAKEKKTALKRFQYSGPSQFEACDNVAPEHYWH